jgi:methylase of polypeptide subunit release factors
MVKALSEATPAFADAETYVRAREVLREAGYTAEGVCSLLGSADATVTCPLDLARVLYRVRGISPLETLIRLFFLTVPVARVAAAAALRPLSLDQWQAASLIRVVGETVEPLVRLRPYQGLYIASDRPVDIRNGDHRPDFVMGVAKSSMLVEHAGLRPNMGHTLDLGTGCGVLGMLARAHSSEVVATDKNRRAAAFAGFNMRLNRMEEIPTLVGDLLDPVADQQFDTILCNPPFVISPGSPFLFCYSGECGDAFCRRLVRNLPAHLNEGGVCTLLANWPHAERQQWADVAAEWFAGLGCDVLAFGVLRQSPDDYATTWIRDIEPGREEDWAARYADWMDFLEQRGIAAISYGVVVLRRASGRPNWVHLEDAPNGFQVRCGTALMRRFQAWDWIHQCTESRQLLDQRFCLPDEFRMRQTLRSATGGLSADGMSIELLGGLSPAINIDPSIAQLLLLTNGHRTLRQVLGQLSRITQVAFDQITDEALPIVRQLVGQGFLRPAGHGAGAASDGASDLG